MTHPIAVTYRPDIDGLRAVAVLAVVGYHASPSLVPGGFIGVDIFFVISGFLISSIILREIEGGTFSLVAFYGRRIRRLFPALIAMLIVTFVLGWYSLLPHEFQTLGKHITAGAAYFINITLKKEAGYFDTSGDMKPLLHLWSLAIEEQFYLIWPLLLLAVAKQRRAFAVIAIVMVASFISSIVVLGRKDAFYLPNNRMWELASGAMLALAVLRLADRQHLSQTLSRFAERFGGARTRDLASCAGLAIILVSLFGLDRTLTYPGYWVLLPCAGALLLISAGESALLNRWLLSHPVLVFIGLISYPFYLWHWPLLSYAAITGYGANPVVRFAMVSLAAVLAALTYLYIERPVRHRKSNVVPISLFGITLAFCVAGTLAQKDVFHARLNGPEHRAISAAVNDWAFPNGLSRTKLPSGLDRKSVV